MLQLKRIIVFLSSFLLLGCAAHNYESRPFFQKEYDAESHGRKTILDRVVETDPGGFKVETSSQYLKDPPARIAVLPFSDVGSANFIVDKIPMTFRNKQERLNWAWTDSQRLRRAFDGYLAQREFLVMPLDSIDAVLQARGIDNTAKLYSVSPQQLGRLLGVDAVVYGTVLHYEAYYLLLIAGWQVGTELKIVSTHTGEDLVIATGSRYSVQIMPALSVEDIFINSAENILELRDIILARAEEETCREIVHRIPVSQELKAQLRQNALRRAEEVDSTPVTPPEETQRSAMSEIRTDPRETSVLAPQ